MRGVGAPGRAGSGEGWRARGNADEARGRELRRSRRATRHREPVDRRRIGMVVVVAQPGGELVVARGIARAQQALSADIAHQRLVLELGDLGVGLRELASGLGLEDAPVAVARFAVEHGRQVGNDGDFVELDHRRRRHEYRPARDDGGMGAAWRWPPAWPRRFGSAPAWRGRLAAGLAAGLAAVGLFVAAVLGGLVWVCAKAGPPAWSPRPAGRPRRSVSWRYRSGTCRGATSAGWLYWPEPEDRMNLHQERAAAVRRLVDEARAIEKAGVTARQPGEDRRPPVVAGRPRRALPPGRVPAGRRRRHLSPEPRIPTIASRSTLRPAAPARRCRRTTTRPGRSSPASMAPSAMSSTTASTTARARTSCSCARRRPRKRR